MDGLPVDLLALCLAAFLAGLMDAVVGGGGLIQVPALFVSLPQVVPASLFGTNKLSGIFGTGAAALGYAKKIQLPWRVVFPAVFGALIFSFLGARLVSSFPIDAVRKSLPFILFAILVYVYKQQEFGFHTKQRFQGRVEILLAGLTGAAIGFYDGLIGPGTGSFLVFIFIRLFGFDFLSASATAKVVNLACNLSALAWFGYAGHVLWKLGFIMALFNIVGARVGVLLALKHGSPFVRRIFLLIVSMLILFTAKQAFFG